MKLHEYQAKALLDAEGVAVPPGFAAESVEEATAAAEKLGGNFWVVKAMVHAGGRGKGRFQGVASQEELEKKLSSLGPDLLSGEVSLKEFRESLRKGSRKNKPISQLLMDQSVVSGVGNYLKAEILYSTKISPHRLCKDISEEELQSLLYASTSIMKRSYESGGATIKNYKSTSGKNGVYTRRFAVYNQKTDPLGYTVVREKTADKRTTHWVPELQH